MNSLALRRRRGLVSGHAGRTTGNRRNVGIALTISILFVALTLSGQQHQVLSKPPGGPAGLTAADRLKPSVAVSTLASALATNQPPVASFTFAPSSPAVDTLVILNATGSFDPDGSITSYFWDFGDGTPSFNTTGPVTSHSYANAGIYTVSIKVADNTSATASTYKYVAVRNNAPPVADFTWMPAIPFAGESMFFDSSVPGAASSDSDGAIVSYLWNLGDGTSQTGIGVLHTYSSPGVYEVILSVTDDDGATTTKPKAVRVQPALALMLASNATDGFAPLFISFNASVYGGQFPYSFIWEFGDRQASTHPSPVHNFTIAGVYRVEVTVTDSLGHTTSRETTITVAGRPGELTFLGVSDATLKVGGGLTAMSVFPLIVYMLVRRRK